MCACVPKRVGGHPVNTKIIHPSAHTHHGMCLYMYTGDFIKKDILISHGKHIKMTIHCLSVCLTADFEEKKTFYFMTEVD